MKAHRGRPFPGLFHNRCFLSIDHHFLIGLPRRGIPRSFFGLRSTCPASVLILPCQKILGKQVILPCYKCFSRGSIEGSLVLKRRILFQFTVNIKLAQ